MIYKKLLYMFSILVVLLLQSSCAVIETGLFSSAHDTKMVDFKVTTTINQKIDFSRKLNFYIYETEEQKISIKDQRIVNQLNELIKSKGYVVTTAPESNVAITYSYKTNEETVVKSAPIIGQTGYSGSSTYFYGNSASTTYTPTYGVVGSQPYTEKEYTNFFVVDVVTKSNENGKSRIIPLYNAVVVEDNPSDLAVENVEYYLHAIFSDFPGKEGEKEYSYIVDKETNKVMRIYRGSDLIFEDKKITK